MTGLYTRALEIFRERGGSQRGLVDRETGRVCLLGACAEAKYGEGWFDTESTESGMIRYLRDPYTDLEITKPLFDMSKEMYPEVMGQVTHPGCVYYVNDDLGYEAALALLEKAAVQEQEKGEFGNA